MLENRNVRVIPTEAYFSLIRQMLAENGQAYVRVTGMSMWPLLRHLRDGVVIAPPEKVRLGDIVLFDRRNGRYVLHRVVGKGKNGFSMAGDHQWHIERGLPYGQIMGVAVALERRGRRVSCNNLLIKMYAGAVTALTFPRIYLWKLAEKAARMLARPFRRFRVSAQKGRRDENQA